MSSDAIKVLHITDPHLFASVDASLRGAKTYATLSAVLNHYLASSWSADLVMMTGDVIQDDTAAAYQRFVELLSPLGLPVYCVPGNHDVRPVMRQTLSDSAFHYCATTEVGNWLIAGIDSCVDDDAGGLISDKEMERLTTILNGATSKHVAIGLHHPPLLLGSKWLDKVGLRNADEFLQAIERSDKVRLVLFGHVHQTFQADHKGTIIVGTPSTCRQFLPKSDVFALDDRSPAYRRVELLTDGNVTSELVWVSV